MAERAEALDAALAAVVPRTVASPPAEDAGRCAPMYRRIGLDPTKTRPSSEALLRRVRKGDPLPRINTLVDICNWCSLEFQLPYGLYDLERVGRPVTLRLGAEGEATPASARTSSTSPIGSTLADDAGPFGNPTSDSARTMVTTATTVVLTVIFAPAGRPAATLGTSARSHRRADRVGGRRP